MSRKKAGPFSLYIDRLRDDDTEKIFLTENPDIFDVLDGELSFFDKVYVSGQAYLAKNHLVLDLKIQAKAKIPCSICNELSETPIVIDDFTHTVELCEVDAAVYDFSDDIRSAVLLKVPQFIECHDGHCPSRKEVKKFFKKPESEIRTPFSDLKIDDISTN